MDALLIGLVIGLLVGIPLGGLAYQWASESGQGESGYEATGDSSHLAFEVPVTVTSPRIDVPPTT